MMNPMTTTELMNQLAEAEASARSNGHYPFIRVILESRSLVDGRLVATERNEYRFCRKQFDLDGLVMKLHDISLSRSVSLVSIHWSKYLYLRADPSDGNTNLDFSVVERISNMVAQPLQPTKGEQRR
jgi:hypothetical protein